MGSILRHGGNAFELESVVGAGAFSRVWKASGPQGAAVAVKILSRRGHGKQARAERAAFQREVDVLQHLSAVEPQPHASLPALHVAFSRPSADVLVLEYIGGGELLDLVNDDRAHALLSESTLRRMWTELTDVVAWLHAHNVVHRDIKLENILLTSRFPAPPPPGAPLLKLTDFGLARAIDPADPWLRTRCGSETYAAPELLLASASADDEPAYTHLSRAPTDGGPEGAYDGRETDAWALGVVLFALATRRLPFGPPAEPAEAERRAWVRRVLKGDVEWPLARRDREDGGEVCGEALGALESVRRIVGRLLVREPAQRAAVAELVGAW
ncbi:kinase-like domain-containing protein [Vararia minispora EC-137]|uniref:Kinase-like domain-containing protein n=1 Tax=Vararia minispora EC-137 TaxID=1314806 RepID=A0ACB8Q8P8_9AGAM|nr:kinase-like domain-containing protein [Vararia minispora EC-137]